jgi:UDP-4-amino-4,6-dideoxy-N-acetyl-beta-L-altrosamine N-acetyltransferase
VYIEAYGIKLIRLEEKHIEMLRQWRNSPHVQNQMEYRNYITEEMQAKWFASIDNENNNYFLIEALGEMIGVISATQIDWVNNITGNGGIFIANEKYIDTDFPARAALLLTDLGFYMGMQKNYVRILADNKQSIAFNTLIGYELLKGQQDVVNRRYMLTKDNYFKKAAKLREALNVAGRVKGVFDNPAHPAQGLIIARINSLPISERSIFEIIIAN